MTRSHTIGGKASPMKVRRVSLGTLDTSLLILLAILQHSLSRCSLNTESNVLLTGNWSDIDIVAGPDMRT